MSITIGRQGNQAQKIESSSVSRQHATLTEIGPNRWLLRDIGSTYGTMVNGMPIVEAEVDADTPIILGHDFSTTVRQLLNLSGTPKVKKPVTPVKQDKNKPAGPQNAEIISVAHLQQVYEDYQEAVKNMVKKKGRAQVMRMLPMQLLMPLALGASGILIDDTQTGNILKGAIMVGVMGLTSVLSLRMLTITNNQADEQFELNQQFQIDYVCPKCKQFFGQAKPYKALINQGKCPYCKAEFVESQQ